jgi:hypothetical protein
VVSDKDSRARSTEDIIGVLNDELNASGVAHNVVKTAADSPLRVPTMVRKMEARTP